MKILSVPITPIAEKNGNVSTQWRLYFEQLTNQLQRGLLDIGYKLPQANNEKIAGLVASDLQGAMIYNSESKNVQANTDGNYKPVNTYEELTSAEIAEIPSGQRNGRFIYDSDSEVLKVGFNDEFYAVTTT
jgi:hypothetical protein